MEFTNEEIIKAIKCHINRMCGDCPMCGRTAINEPCHTLIFEAVLNLIEGQNVKAECVKAEILRDFAEKVRQRLIKKGFYPVIFKNTLDEVLKESEVTNMKGKFIPVNERKYYMEIDGIRLIYEDGELVGWYNPGGEIDEDN